MTDTDVRRIEDKVDNLALVLAELRGSLTPTLDKLTDRQADQEKRLEEYRKDADERLEDHETRLRASERFRFAFPSLALLSLLVSIGVLVYYLATLKG